MNAATLLRSLVLVTFPVGWYVSYPLVDSHNIYYFLLTVLCATATLVLFVSLGNKFKQSIHIWIILLLCWMAYFLKFYILCYMKINQGSYGDYLELSYATEASLLGRSELIISYFELVTAVWMCFAATMIFIFSLKSSYFRKTTIRTFMMRKRVVSNIIMTTVSFSLFMIGVQVFLGLGIVSAGERNTIELPFRLAGIIMTVNNVFLPLIFLVTVWLADLEGTRQKFRIAIVAYMSYGLISGIISTSRSVFVFVVVSLLVLWLITEKMSKKRAAFILVLMLFTIFLNGVLTVNRILRSVYPNLDGFEIFNMVITQYILPAGAAFSSTEANLQISAGLSTLMRVNGSDSLLIILDYAPRYSSERSFDILTGSLSSAESYANDVLGLPQLFGVAFSPSLLGFFMLMFGNNIFFICFAFVLYLLVWHVLLRRLLNLKLFIEPIVMVLLLLILARFTSEGTLEALPSTIGLLMCFGLIAEWCLRRLIRYPGVIQV